MSADLQARNAPPPRASTSIELHTRLRKTISVVYLLTQLAILSGLGFALFQNWTLRLENVQSNLVRNANIGNFLVESALTSAIKALDNTKPLLEKALKADRLSQALAGQILYASDANFRRSNKTETFGLLLYLDKNGKLYAQSNGMSETAVDLSDRQYFSQLREDPRLQVAHGPLVLSRATGQWVFHVAVPLRNAYGVLDGVLVQEILANDIAAKLKTFAQTGQFEHMLTQYDGLEPSFLYPLPGNANTPDSRFLLAWKQRNRREMPTKGLYTWDRLPSGLTSQILLGAATSPTYVLTTFVSLPTARLYRDFWIENIDFLLYWVIGIGAISAIFYYVYRLSSQLAMAQLASLHDPLTQLHNRRALDETLPNLLRDSMRSQAPISVLFVDIDHFRYFNENFGHESGDIALAVVASTLRACARRPLDFVCRWGGEEFVLVLPKTDRMAAQSMAERILVAVRAIELHSIKGHHPKLTVSVGYATTIATSVGTQEDLVDNADKAMLQAKSRGRNQRAEYVPAGYSEAPGAADRFVV